MPDTALTALPAAAYTAEALILTQRRPALAGFIFRRLLTFAPPLDLTARQAKIETCRAELDWAYADWRRIVADKGLGFDVAAERAPAWGTPAWQLTLLPVEKAAQTVLNIWGHLQPNEYRAVACWQRMHAQRRAGWTDRAMLSATELRLYLAARRINKAHFSIALGHYERLRGAIDRPTSPASCARAA
jgi:hypothetical protein